MDLKTVKEILDDHHGKLLGIIMGLIFGWFTITHGIIKAVFVSACIWLGYYIGKKIDENTDWRSFINRLFDNR